jgi:hypothetical protein
MHFYPPASATNAQQFSQNQNKFLTWRFPLKILFTTLPLASLAVSAWLAGTLPAPAQSLSHSETMLSTSALPLSQEDFSANSREFLMDDASSTDPGIPAAPEPAGVAGGFDHYEVKPAATWHQIPFSRVGIGADVSPLGIGIKGAIVLNHYFDARVMGNFFGFDTGRFEVDGFNVDAKVHMASAAASLDWYPFNSVWRLSPGVMFFNGNQLSGIGTITPGTSFTLENQTYYSATANPVTGATPMVGTGVLSLHRNSPAATATFGFGKFIPRSDRHWSFPSEFGVVFTGSPTINVNVTGWACLDARQTQCSNIGDPKNPIAIDFNNNLQGQLDKWRRDLDKVSVYPIFSYSVVYSFNIR